MTLKRPKIITIYQNVRKMIDAFANLWNGDCRDDNVANPKTYPRDGYTWDLARYRLRIMETWYRRLLLDNRNVTPGWLTRHCPDNHRPPPPPPGLLIAPERPRRRETSCATRAPANPREKARLKTASRRRDSDGGETRTRHLNPFVVALIQQWDILKISRLSISVPTFFFIPTTLWNHVFRNRKIMENRCFPNSFTCLNLIQ